MGLLDPPIKAARIIDATVQGIATITGDAVAARAASGSAEQLVQIADNCYGTPVSGGSGINTVGTYEFFYNVGTDASEIRVGFGQWVSTSVSPKVDADVSSVTFSAAIRDTSGNVFALTFGGARTVTHAGGLILSDVLPIDVARGDRIYVRVYISAGAGRYNRLALGNYSSTYGGFTATTDLTASGAAAVTAAFAAGWGPMCILGSPTNTTQSVKSVVIQGDSIAFGDYDGFSGDQYAGYNAGNTIQAGGGYPMRALSGVAGIINVALAGDCLMWFLLNAGHFRKGSLTKYVRSAFIEYGINDLANGRTAAQLQADLLTQARRNRAKGVINNVIVTITPQASSTDRFTTTTNQTTAVLNTERVSHNNWVRDGGPIDATTKLRVNTGTVGALRFGATGHPIKGYVEVADVVESARDSGKWKNPDRVVTNAAITTGTPTLTSATANFTSADLGRTVIVAGAGAAGVDLTSTIGIVGSTTSVTLMNNASTTVSGATAVIGAWTDDGVHPRANGHASIAAAIQTPLLALL